MHAALPGPTPLPLIGNLLDLEDGMVSAFTRYWHTYGDVFQLRFGTSKAVVVVSPDDVEHILRDRGGRYGRGLYRRLERITGEGLLVSEGAVWKRSRRTLQPLFQRRAVRTLVPDLVRVTDELLERWAGRDTVDDLTHEMGWVTLRAITRTLFDWDVGDELDRFCDDVHVLAQSVNARIFYPQLVSQLPLAANRRFDAASRRIQQAIEDRIAERRSAASERDLLGRLLAARDEDGEPLSNEQIRDELITLFIAGHETTALTLTWALVRLSQHPAWLEAVSAEACALEGGIDMDALRRLPMTLQVIQEVLRLHPSAWIFIRQALADDVLPSGHTIPSGATVILSPYLTHRHPEHWPQPLGFDPRRFAPGAPRRHPCAYFPFGRAARMCMGSELALLEGVVITARILQRVRPTVFQPVQERAQGTLRPAGKIPLRLAWVG